MFGYNKPNAAHHRLATYTQNNLQEVFNAYPYDTENQLTEITRIIAENPAIDLNAPVHRRGNGGAMPPFSLIWSDIESDHLAYIDGRGGNKERFAQLIDIANLLLDHGVTRGAPIFHPPYNLSQYNTGKDWGDKLLAVKQRHNEVLKASTPIIKHASFTQKEDARKLLVNDTTPKL